MKADGRTAIATSRGPALRPPRPQPAMMEVGDAFTPFTTPWPRLMSAAVVAGRFAPNTAVAGRREAPARVCPVPSTTRQAVPVCHLHVEANGLVIGAGKTSTSPTISVRYARRT